MPKVADQRQGFLGIAEIVAVVLAQIHGGFPRAMRNNEQRIALRKTRQQFPHPVELRIVDDLDPIDDGSSRIGVHVLQRIDDDDIHNVELMKR